MDEKYISDKEFDSLSEEKQVQVLIDMIKDVPRNELMLLRKTFLEILKSQEALKKKSNNNSSIYRHKTC